MLYAGAWLLHEVITNIQDLLFFPFINQTIRNLQLRSVAHLHGISFLESQNFESVKVISALKRISLASRNFLRIHMLLLLPCSLKIISTGYLIVTQTTYGFTFVGGLLMTLVSIGLIMPRYAKIRKKAWHVTDEMGNTIAHSLFQPHSSRAFFDYELQRVQRVADEEQRAWLTTNNYLNYLHIMMGISLTIMIFSPLIFAVKDYSHTLIYKEDLIVLQAQLMLIAVPMRHLMTEIRQLVEAAADMGAIQHILQLKKERLKPNNLFMQPADKAIQIRNLHFSYYSQKTILKDVSADIFRGDKILLNGHSGVGKSTLLNIIGGIFPHSEAVQQNDTLTKMYIPQKSLLINDSLRNNLTYGITPCDEESLQEVLAICALEDLIFNLPQGLETKVGNLGASLSEGERQRILIARALLQRPHFLIMDEALDSIDWDKRDALYERLWACIETILWTSHDQRAQTYASRSWGLDGGSLVENH